MNANNENHKNEESIVMYILVNNDLQMGKGKIASQVGHVVGQIVEEIIINKKKQPQNYELYQKWSTNHGHIKIVLKATTNDLLTLIETENKCKYIIDAGRTQIEPNSLTVVGFYPRSDMREKLSKFKLL
jgi:peptidyl-tRNA hydrolase